MRQFIGQVHDDSTVRDLLVSVAPRKIGEAAAVIDVGERAVIAINDERAQMTYAQALADWADVGGYQYEVLWDICTTAALGVPYERAQFRGVSSLSGGEQKRLVLEALLRGPEEVLVLDEPDNYLDVPGKRWLEDRLVASTKTVLFVSHDRELLSRVATRVVTLEPGVAGSTAWMHSGGFATWNQARAERNSRLEELRRRWEEDRAKLRAQMLMYKQKAAYNSDMASRYQAAQTRMAKFDTAGPPEQVTREQNVRMRLTGGRTAKRAITCDRLELRVPAGPSTRNVTLMKPFDLEIWFDERVAVLGSNGSGKSHFLRLLAGGGSDPDREHLPVGEIVPASVEHTGAARLGSRVRPGWFAQTHKHPSQAGRTLLEILHRGDEQRAGRSRDEAARVLDRYGLARAAEQTFESLSGGQQARFHIMLLELSGATLLLLDEPTDNWDLHSAEALEHGIASFEGTVLTVTHDRWFVRGFDRFLVFGQGGSVYESDEPVW